MSREPGAIQSDRLQRVDKHHRMTAISGFTVRLLLADSRRLDGCKLALAAALRRTA